MAPAVAQRHTAQAEPARPDGTERRQQHLEDDGRRQLAVDSPRGHGVEQHARPAHRLAQPPQQGRAAFEADQGIVGADLEGLGQHVGVHPRQGVGPQRIVPVGRQGAGLEQPQRGDPQALRTAQQRAGRRVPIAPGRPRAGVQQHRSDRQVEGGPGLVRRLGPGLVPLGPEVAAVNDEVPPTGVKGHIEVRIGLAHHLRRQVGGRLEPGEIRAPLRDLAGKGGGQHLMGALANRGRRKQAARRLYVPRAFGQRPQNSLRSRPTTRFRSALVGGFSGVK